MNLLWVGDSPSSISLVTDVSCALALLGNGDISSDERVPCVISFGSCRSIGKGKNIGLDDGVVQSVDHWVDADGE